MIDFRGKKKSKNSHRNIPQYHSFFTTNSTRNFLEFNPVIHSENKGSNQLSCEVEIGNLIIGSRNRIN
jgi:hypothetical protein